MNPAVQYALIPLALVMVFALCIPYLAMFVRSRFNKKARGSALVIWWPPAGYGTMEFIPLKGDKLVLPPKKGVRRREYSISKLSTAPFMYPFNFPSWLQVPATAIVYDSETYEPLTNRAGNLTLSPVRLAGTDSENVVAKGIEQMNTEANGEQPHKRSILPWVIAGILLVAVVAMAVMFMNMSGEVDMLKAGLGVQ